MRHFPWYSAISTVLLISSLAVLVDPAAPAFASCAAPVAVGQALADSDLVFVGTVVGLTNGRRWATFKVDELWKGTPSSRHVQVRAGPADPAGPNQAASSVDRRYEAGVRYLVFARDPKAHGSSPIWGSDNRFEDNDCSSTQPYDLGLSRFRPATAQSIPETAPHPPSVRAQPESDDLPWAFIVWLLGAFIVAVGVAMIVRRRSRTHQFHA